MRYPDHPRIRESRIVECPHCKKRYPAEDGPVCVRCGGRLSTYNTRATPVDEYDGSVYEAVRETRENDSLEWNRRTVITFE